MFPCVAERSGTPHRGANDNSAASAVLRPWRPRSVYLIFQQAERDGSEWGRCTLLPSGTPKNLRSTNLARAIRGQRQPENGLCQVRALGSLPFA